MRPVALSDVLSWLRSSGLLAGGATLPDVDGNLELTGFAAVDRAGAADATFWLGGTASSDTHANGYASSVFESVRAGLLFAPPDCAGLADRLPGVRCLAVVENPYHAMVEFLNRFASDSSDAAVGCASSAKVHAGAVVEGLVGENCVIGPGCVVMRGAKVGAGCVLEANVTVYPNVEIGEPRFWFLRICGQAPHGTALCRRPHWKALQFRCEYRRGGGLCFADYNR